MRTSCSVFLLLLFAISLTFGQTLINHRVLSGNGSDLPTVIATDSGGFVYMAGNTTSGNFPVTNALEAQPPQGALEVSINGAAFVNLSLKLQDISFVGVLFSECNCLTSKVRDNVLVLRGHQWKREGFQVLRLEVVVAIVIRITSVFDVVPENLTVEYPQQEILFVPAGTSNQRIASGVGIPPMLVEGKMRHVLQLRSY